MPRSNKERLGRMLREREFDAAAVDARPLRVGAVDGSERMVRCMRPMLLDEFGGFVLLTFMLVR